MAKSSLSFTSSENVLISPHYSCVRVKVILWLSQLLESRFTNSVYFAKFGKFSAIISSILFYFFFQIYLLSSSPSGTLITWILDLLLQSYSSWRFIFSLFSIIQIGYIDCSIFKFTHSFLHLIILLLSQWFVFFYFSFSHCINPKISVWFFLVLLYSFYFFTEEVYFFICFKYVHFDDLCFNILVI